MKTSYIKIKNSKFYGYYYTINNVNEVLELIDSIKKNNKKCKHICYAYKIGSLEKRYEDKEPSGTSGSQILNIINYNNDNNVLIVIVRYFGGTLLGIGPLSKAYKDCTIQLYKKDQN